MSGVGKGWGSWRLRHLELHAVAVVVGVFVGNLIIKHRQIIT